MYYDIESVKSDPLISDEYPYGNPFDHIIDIMNYGAINLTYGKHYDVITKMIICMV
jgi:hypothetical protein